MEQGFVHESPERLGIPTGSIVRFLERAREAEIELHSMMLLRHGRLCFQNWWAPYAPERPHLMYSFGKSLVSTAIGFAVREGAISPEERVIDSFEPETKGIDRTRWGRVTVAHLLSMTCGQESEPAGSEDWIEGFFRQPLVFEPGTHFQYNTAGTNILCALLYRKTGKQLTEYLRPRLFDPLGIGPVRCGRLPDGTEGGGNQIRMRTEDMARFLRFLMGGGKWGEAQLLDSDWVERATATQIDTTLYGGDLPDWSAGYGYQFWRCRPEGCWRADGLFGQMGIAMPDRDALLIVTTVSPSTQALLDALWGTIYVEMGDSALPPDPAAEQRLRELIGTSTLCPYAAGMAETSAIVGETFAAPEGVLLGIDAAVKGIGLGAAAGRASALRFAREDAVLSVQVKGFTEDYTIFAGLDGAYRSSKVFGEEIVAVASMPSEHRLLLEVRAAEGPGGVRYAFERDGDGLNLSSEYIPRGYKEWPEHRTLPPADRLVLRR